MKNVSGNAKLLHPLQKAENNNGETSYAEVYQKALSERKGSNSEGATMLGIIGKNMFGLSAPSKPKTGLAFAHELFINSQYDIPEGKGSGAPHGHHREWDRSGGSKGLGETIHSHTFGTKSDDKQKWLFSNSRLLCNQQVDQGLKQAFASSANIMQKLKKAKVKG